MEDVVIGSGPAGVAAAWALLEQGRHVTMLDVGEQLETEKSDLRSRLAGTEPGQWSAEDLRSYTHARRSGKYDTIRPFGSDFLFRDPGSFLDDPEPNTSIGLKPSFAAGGLSNGWGASILPYRLEDLLDWPAATRDLGPHYEALRDFMPMAGKVDALQDLFPMLAMPEHTSLPLGTQAEALLGRLEMKKEQLNRAGVYFGQARQAVNQECRKCGMCLYGCPYGVIFNATQTRDKMLENSTFSYRKGFCISRFEERDSGVRLWASDMNIKQEVQFSARRVFVACGVLPTFKLLMSSLECYDRPVYMKDSQHFYLPLLHSWKSEKDPGSEGSHSLVQLFIEIIDPSYFEKTAHVQIYTFNDLYPIDMRKRFGPFAELFSPLIKKLSQRLIVAQGFLHSDYSPQIEMRLIREGRKAVLRMEEKSNAITKEAMGFVRNKISQLSRQAGLLPLTPLSRPGSTGSSFHCGSTFPMKDQPTDLESDTLGRPAGLRRVFIVDASVLPDIPATTITLSVMANAHRIAMQSNGVTG